MGTSRLNFEEIRFVFADPELTEVYVFLRDLTPNETPIGAAGWKHKTYPARKNAIQILNLIGSGEKEHDPIMWDQGAP